MKLRVDYGLSPGAMNIVGLPKQKPLSKTLAEVDLERAVLRQTPRGGLNSSALEEPETFRSLVLPKENHLDLVMADIWMLHAMRDLKFTDFSGDIKLLLTQDPSDTTQDKGGLIFFPGSTFAQETQLTLEVKPEHKPGQRTSTEKVFRKVTEERRFIFGLGALQKKQPGETTRHLCRWDFRFFEKAAPEMIPKYIGVFGSEVWWLFFPPEAIVPV